MISQREAREVAHLIKVTC